MLRRKPPRSERLVAHLVGLTAVSIALGMVALVGTLVWVLRLWRFF